MLRECSELPGYEIFRYKTKSGFESITSIELNEYLNQLNKDIDFSAKDFRTWGANCLALQKAEEAKEIIRKNPRRKIETTLVKLVAREMGNTVSICRKYYLHPKVIEAACASKFPEEFKESTLYYDPEERWLLDILK
jgi:DNA topoisomerase-1